MTILITGANGKFGTDCINYLLEKGFEAKEIVALVRSEEKGKPFSDRGVIVKIGDYNDLKSLEEAFKGIETLLFVSSSKLDNVMEQHGNVIKASKTAGIKHLLYTSLYRNNLKSDSKIHSILKHNETEDLIIESGLTYSILLNGLYSDVLNEHFFGPHVLEKGIFYPAGKNSQVSYSTRNDLAEAAANLLSLNNVEILKYQNRFINLSGDTSDTLEDAANYLSEISGKQVNYISPDLDTFRNALSSFNVPSSIIEFSIAFALAIENGDFKSDSTELTTILKRNPTNLKQFLSKIYKK